MGNNKNEWKRLYNKKGILVYEGFTKNNKPCGAGTSYYSNGSIFQEGIFGVKGFLCGREYYQSGKLRFEGVCELNRNYGPNYPRYGFFQTEDGSVIYEGEFKLSFDGVGYPTVKKPGEYGAIRSRSDLCLCGRMKNPETIQISTRRMLIRMKQCRLLKNSKLQWKRIIW